MIPPLYKLCSIYKGGLLWKGEKMEKFGSAEDILDFSIRREEESIRFYTDFASKTDNKMLSFNGIKG